MEVKETKKREMLPLGLRQEINRLVKCDVLVGEVANIISNESLQKNKRKIISSEQLLNSFDKHGGSVDLLYIQEFYVNLKLEIEDLARKFDVERKQQQKQRELERETLVKLNNYLDEWR